MRRVVMAAMVLVIGVPAYAHEVRPAYLELREQHAGEFAALWKTPMRGETRLSLSPEFSGSTEIVASIVTREAGGAAVQTWRLKAVDPLRGQSVRIQGLDATMTDALVRMEFADGTTWVKRLTPAEPEAKIPERPSRMSVAGEYLMLGVEHILLGIDHLLFVLALLIMTKGTWPLVKTVTAFTLAHSMTLALAVLGFVHVPQAPVEAVIALSIAFMASEIVHARNGREGLTARAPWIVAFAFGLLHGFGFAGALSEIGLPQGEIPVALLFFNIGVEGGQLMFIAAVLALLALGRRVAGSQRLGVAESQSRRVTGWSASTLRLFDPSTLRLALGYGMGSVAMFWVIQRVMTF